MRLRYSFGIIAGALLLVGGLTWADKESAAQEELEKDQKQVDAAVVQAGGTVAKELSDQFELKPELIQKMKDGRPGWGEIAILLCMSNQLSMTHPKDYPTYKDALKKVRSLRSENASYERIAKLLDFDLDPVIIEVHGILIRIQSDKRFPDK